jgi:pyruvate/2-oxoglutarate dehydrogenase complex dihydrolipoamide dehydrogenase (E3) component
MGRPSPEKGRGNRHQLQIDTTENRQKTVMPQALLHSSFRKLRTVVIESKERRIEGSHLLVATGRVANTSNIGLDKAGIALTPRGIIQVDDRLKTTAPGVWAIGECAGSPLFTHVSVDDFRIVRDNMAGANRSTTDRLIPHVVFTDPPLARVGLSEGEAQRQGIPVRVAKLPMGKVLRTAATDEKEGFMKVLVGSWDKTRSNSGLCDDRLRGRRGDGNHTDSDAR